MLRPVFERQRHPGRPHPAHADAEEAAEGEQHHVGGRGAAQEREGGVPGDRKQDRALAAVAIGERAGADAADHPEQQRDRAEQPGQRLVHREALLDVGEDEGEDGEVERVEHPGGEGGEEGLPLSGGHLVLEQAKKFVLTEDVRHALMYAEHGEADGAFVYKTDALLTKNAKTLFTVDAVLHDKITYPMLLTAAGAKNAAAKAFYDYLSGPEAKAVLEKHGFAANP